MIKMRVAAFSIVCTVVVVAGFSIFTMKPASADAHLLAQSDTSATRSESISIVEALSSDPDVTLFFNALKQSGLDAVIDELTNPTVFVPTNSAMEMEGSAFLLESVLLAPENAERLVDLLALHIVREQLPASAGKDSGHKIGSLQGRCLSIVQLAGGAEKPGILVGYQSRLTRTRHLSNGVIHYIDRLIHQSFDDSSICPATY